MSRYIALTDIPELIVKHVVAISQPSANDFGYDARRDHTLRQIVRNRISVAESAAMFWRIAAIIPPK
jgi:hypothetical protein